jgi:hypothetical protein
MDPQSAPAWTPAALTGHVETWIGSMLGADASAIASWAGLTGTHALAQGTGASQPVVGTDTGKKYASFDGIDDWLVKGAYTQGSTAGHAVFAAIRMTANGNFPIFFDTLDGFREFRCSGVTRIPQTVTNDGGGTVSNAAALTTGTDYVIGFSTDYSTDAVTLYLDGVSVATGTDNTNPAVRAAAYLSMGARSGGTLPFPGRIYSLSYLECPALSAANVALLTAYHQAQKP